MIENARQKRLIAEVKQWEVTTWTYLDRTGRFPGDANRDGIIWDGDVKADFAGSGLASAPSTNTLSLGSSTFFLFLGNVWNSWQGWGPNSYRNIIAVCLSNDCGTAFATGADLDFVRSVDTSLDGIANGTSGRVRATTTSLYANSATWIAGVTDPTYVDWTSGTRALLYFFDRQP